ncbi:DUF4244 domain-containing protein [Streptomyces sp. bgisy154]|uniref:DUF4244 domain-containing protein n=1 Tax=Streptomyces sp. bgisy154 TaxID=3413794 RepID=UPI003D740AE2
MYKTVCGVRARMRALVRAVWVRPGARRDAGMVTSEYAMGIVAAVAFAVLLYKVVTSPAIAELLQETVKRALSAGT